MGRRHQVADHQSESLRNKQLVSRTQTSSPLHRRRPGGLTPLFSTAVNGEM
ncbi:hypothetical protein [Aeoliella mucimassa]|uniref:hypothetical protein n=1 Tax=Aeoliella mucimassa TaxID=2527972 RepID=UPI0018D2B193|nr:hypothetical protein [Aeoliella mucimassa]